MGKSPERRTSISPAATALVTTTTASSFSSTNPAESSSPSPYFLPELIPLVASRLTTLQDFFALRATCRTYRALLLPSPANLASQAPLLLVSDGAPASEALLHAPLRRLLRFGLDPRNPGHTRFHSFGCCVTIDECNAHASSRELRIHHLLTGERERTRLPEPPIRCGERIILSGDLALISRAYLGVLHYCRIGDGQWRAAECAERGRLYSLIFVKGTLYAVVSPNHRLAIVELRNNSAELLFLGVGDELSALTVQPCSVFWLADCGGELLLVVAMPGSPWVFHVLRWQSGERKWARTTSLGGRSLFFNVNRFAGCLGPNHPGVQRDCMYFTWGSGKWTEYSLVDGSRHEHVVDYPGRAATATALAWVLPSIG